MVSMVAVVALVLLLETLLLIDAELARCLLFLCSFLDLELIGALDEEKVEKTQLIRAWDSF